MIKRKETLPAWLITLFLLEFSGIVFFLFRLAYFSRVPFESIDFLRGVFIVWGIVLTGAMVAQTAVEENDDKRVVWQALMPVVFWGVFVARLFYISFPPPSTAVSGITSPLDYWQNLSLFINLLDGGLRIEGAVLGGLFGWLLFLRRHQLAVFEWSDRLAMFAFVGFVIGQWGNLFSNSPYGLPTAVPWAWPIDTLYRLPEFADYVTFHPLFLYLSIWYTAAAALPFYLSKADIWHLRRGDYVVWFFALFLLGRLLILPLQLNEPPFAITPSLSIPASFLFMLPILLVALLWRAFALKQRQMVAR